ncbi:dihydrodipicolinate reductases (plasmid) [Legionella adelaidensis]|uniref:4-hydroxy-tetrahydrodipicolinate reductase n=1 Tax=Legionella adelaidensis TaxID=45056 RepID=A0A0W0R0Q0_9GAMM|nr:4-hydroxy-tetrahydrodipicolinate reductase [Legionella adelaidensis]KTC64675.1 4-hydroxy-tetrahydrodipicolinate reductase [Legionella adelaidensis]VEH86143.1 dihydrodipicolinate reductases [Legionella adelaidensis]
MKKKIIVNGSYGKMGSLACETLKKNADFEIVAETGSKDNLLQCIQKTLPDIVLDLTRADCAYENALTVVNAGVSPVIGTSGLLPDQVNHLKSICDEKKLGGIIVPNFSIAAVLMMHFAKLAAQFLPEVEIIEAHHQQKQDAPSGTAIKTAEMIAAGRKDLKNKLEIKEVIPGVRGGMHQEINIHSLRLPGVLAEQQVIFGSVGETLTLKHTSIDRSSFMPGVVLACQQVTQLKSLCYGLEYVLNL